MAIDKTANELFLVNTFFSSSYRGFQGVVDANALIHLFGNRTPLCRLWQKFVPNPYSYVLYSLSLIITRLEALGTKRIFAC